MTTRADDNGVASRLAWVLIGLLGLVWTGLYLLLRLLEGSYRVWFAALALGLACLVVSWNLGAMGLGVVSAAGLLLGALLVVGAQESWVEYRQKLDYLADASPACRLVHVDGDLYARLRDWRGLARRLPILLAALVVAVLLVVGWRELSPALRAAVADVVASLAAVLFLFQAGVVFAQERRRQVAYFVRGARLVDPAAWETRLSERWPVLAPVLAWRARWLHWLAPVSRGARALRQPRGVCEG